MIIVEGPDGGGKTRLLDRLTEHYTSIPVHPRASEGVDGPVKDLFEWAHKDVTTWRDKGLHFYDRHPLISEYIYGPTVRGHVDPRFYTTALRRRLVHRALIIVCLPPLCVVRASVNNERDMPGVMTHIDTIWSLYASLTAQLPTVGVVRYDFTEDDYTDLFPHINSHRTHWSVTR